MPILEMETTLDISRQLNDTNPPAQFVTTCGVGISEMGDRSKVTMTEGHAAGSGRVDGSRMRKRPAAGQPARTSETARTCALAWTHTALELHLFVSILDPVKTWLWHVWIHLHFFRRLQILILCL